MAFANVRDYLNTFIIVYKKKKLGSGHFMAIISTEIGYLNKLLII